MYESKIIREHIEAGSWSEAIRLTLLEEAFKDFEAA